MTLNMDADLPKDPNHNLDNNTEVSRVIFRISPEDKEYSLALRKGGKLSPEDFEKELSEQHARLPYIKALSKQIKGEALTKEDLQSINKQTIDALNPGEKGRLLNAILNGNFSSAAYLRVSAVLASLNSSQLDEFTSTLTLSVTSFNALFRAASNQNLAPALGESIVRSKLRDAAKTIEDKDLRDKFLIEDISDRDLIDVLGHVSAKTRLHVLQTLFKLSTLSDELSTFFQEKIDNALIYCSANEKVALGKSLLANEQTEVTVPAMLGLMRSLDTSEELQKFVQALGEKQLIELSNSKITNLVAYALLSPLLEKAKIPDALSPRANNSQVQVAFLELNSAIKERKDILQENKDLTQTDMVREYLTMIEELNSELKMRVSKADKNIHKLRYAHNIILEKMDLAFSYGVYAKDSQDKMVGFGEFSPGVEWKLSELADVREALHLLPELRLLDTPRITNIERVKDLGRSVMGARYPDGTIRIADFAIRMPEVEEIFPGYSSLTAVLVHELLHGIQLGAESGGINESENGELNIEPGEKIVDFDEFTKISGWTPIAKDRWDPVYGGRAIKLDGEIYHLGVPVMHKGESIIITFSRGTVYTRKAFTGFSLDLYSSVNPWEDFAETATEYFLAPERLIELSPEKFHFFEQEFGIYRDRDDLKKLLEIALKKSSKKLQA